MCGLTHHILINLHSNLPSHDLAPLAVVGKVDPGPEPGQSRLVSLSVEEACLKWKKLTHSNSRNSIV